MDMCLITGIPGSGKTVLLSTLILRHKENFWARNTEAQKFENDAEVLDQQKWPEATNPLAPQRTMQWDFSCKGIKSRLAVADKAGEAWETFVLENQEPDPVPALLETIRKMKAKLEPQEQKDLDTIGQQFRHAACVCILIDLSEDINQGKNIDQQNFSKAVVNYLDKIGRTCPVALVVTKCNSYGSKALWEPIFKERYEKVFVEYCGKGKVWSIFTDAVADTDVDDENNIVPALNFKSEGLENLIGWLGDRLKAARAKRTLMIAAISVATVLILAFMVYWLPTWVLLLILAITIAFVIIKAKHVF